MGLVVYCLEAGQSPRPALRLPQKDIAGDLMEKGNP